MRLVVVMTRTDQRTSRAIIVTFMAAVATALTVALLRPTPVAAAGVVGTGTRESCTEAALDAALAGGGMVTFDCGAGPVTITITRTKTIAADTTIDGGFLITISGGNSVNVFAVDTTDTTFAVQNLTIANGWGLAAAGIHNQGTLTVTNSAFSGNQGGAFGPGGAVLNWGSLTVINSTFSGNSAGGAGSASVGGAIAQFGGTLTVTNSTFSGNSAGFDGGAIYLEGGAVTVTNSTFSGNRGGFSGTRSAIAQFGGTLTVTNSTFSDNSGAIAVSSDACGGQPCPATLRNTIVANSSSADNCSDQTCFSTMCRARITDGGHNLDSDGTCGVGPATDPLLDPAGLANNGGPTQTIALDSDSPAINAGDPSVCTDPPVNGIDQRGFVRPGTGHTNCSIGAYEADAIPPEVCTGDCNGNGIVAINELVVGVNIIFGYQPVNACPAFANSQQMVDVAQLVKGVNNVLIGCAIG